MSAPERAVNAEMEWPGLGIPKTTLEEDLEVALQCLNDPDENDYENALRLKKDYAEARQRLAKTQNELGLLYLNGSSNIPKDFAQAFQYFSQAAELGLPAAHFNLGSCYESGEGTPSDSKKALEHYEQAAKKGVIFSPEKCYDIAVLYLRGMGHQEALSWLLKSAEAGFEPAIFDHARKCKDDKEHKDHSENLLRKLASDQITKTKGEIEIACNTQSLLLLPHYQAQAVRSLHFVFLNQSSIESEELKQFLNAFEAFRQGLPPLLEDFELTTDNFRKDDISFIGFQDLMPRFSLTLNGFMPRLPLEHAQQTLRILELRECHLDKLSLDLLSKFLQENRMLSQLILTNLDVSPDLEGNFLDSFVRTFASLETHPELYYLHLKVDFGDNAGIALAALGKMLFRNKLIRKLFLELNVCEDYNHLLPALEVHPFEVLHLDRVNDGDKDPKRKRARNIISALSRQNASNPPLKHLHYSDLNPWADFLLEYPIRTLETIEMGYNTLSDLKKLLETHRSLTSVELDQSNYEPNTNGHKTLINDFMEVLEHKHGLTSLDMDRLCFNVKENWERFKKALEQNHRLIKLEGISFQFSAKEKAVFEGLLLRNQTKKDREQYNFGKACLTMAFIRANSASPLRTSVFPLSDDTTPNGIMQLAGCKMPERPEDRVNVDRFLSTGFARSHLNAPPLTAPPASRKRPLL